jgi:hypothetical protein
MGTHLARQLERYYTKTGNRIVFRNGLTLTRLAWEMEVDPGFLSKVVNGKDRRLLSRPQRESLCKVLGLSSGECWDLEYAFEKDYRLQHDLEDTLSIPLKSLQTATDHMTDALYDQLREVTHSASTVEFSRTLHTISSFTFDQTAVLFAATRHEQFSPNEIYRYIVPGPGGVPVLDRTITDPALNSISGLAFSPAGELFVSNVSPDYVSGSIVRIRNPLDTPVVNGVITSRQFTSPVGEAFVNGELFVAQVRSNNVLRFNFNALDEASFHGAITEHLCGTAPRNVAVSPAGNELFITECLTISEINRYALNANGNAILRGVIRGGGLCNPHNLAFSPWGELYVANTDNDSVSRFVFDTLGNALPNGQITGPTLDHPLGLDFSPWGELFVGNHYGSGGISRWLFDASHHAIPNGFFPTPYTLADIKFSPIPLPRLAGLTVNMTAILAQASDHLLSGQTSPASVAR